MNSVRDLLLVNQSNLKKLPVSYASLVDPMVPLPADVRFYPLVRTWKDVRNNILFGIIGLLIGLVAGYVTLNVSFFSDAIGKGVANVADDPAGYVAAIPGTIALIGFLFGLVSLNSTRSTVRIVRARQSGKAYRFGLFISAQAVLIQEENRYNFLGKNRIVEVDRSSSGATRLAYYKVDKSKTKEKTGDNGGEDKLIHCTLPKKLEALSLDGIFDLVQNWSKAT